MPQPTPVRIAGVDSQRRPRSPSFDQLKDEIFDVLSATQGPSSFACGGVLKETQNPDLCLEDHGAIGLPLSRNDAQIIISKCEQSPFGKGSETVVDTSIRKSWQLNPSQFTIRNPKWQQTIKDIVSKIHGELLLDIELDSCSAELYKLLLYEPGAFFKAHKDSEKAPGMFGTLVICLPSAHEGGELILNFNGATKSIQTASSSALAMSYAAWYADVLHEVKPVTSGYRLVLTYNLICLNAAGKGRVPPVTSFEDQYNLIAALTKYNEQLQHLDSLPNFLVYRLEHQYTQASLRADRLKGPDFGRLQCLKQVADELGFGLYLANMEKEIIMSDDSYEDRHYDYYDDEEDDGEDDEEDDYKLKRDDNRCDEEELSRSITLKYVVNLDGRRIDRAIDYRSSGVAVDEETFVGFADEEDEEPDDEEHSGFTGNEGCTATYWYRTTVIVIVPPARKVHFLCECDRRNVRVTALMQDLRYRAKNDPTAKKDLAKVCGLVLQHKNEYRYQPEEQKSKPILMQEAIASAIQCERFDLYDGLTRGVTEPTTETLWLLGRSMGCNVRPEIAQRIEAALDLARTLSQRHESLMIVSNGAHSTLGAYETVSVQYKIWAQQLLVKPLMTAMGAEKLSKADGARLVNIVADWTVKDVQENILPAIVKCGTACKVAFANGLAERVDDVDISTEIDEASSLTFNPQACVRFSKAVYTDIWESFVFESLRLPPVASTGAARGIDGMYGTPPQPAPPPKPEEQLLDGSDLARLLGGTLSLGVLAEAEMKSRLRSAVEVAGRDACNHTMVPFVKLVFGQKVECLKLDPHSNRASEEDKNLVTAMLVRFIVAGVGPEPSAPTNWSQPRGGCRLSSCSDCSRVNEFLAAPDRQVGQYPVGKARRHHLHSFFTDKPGGNYSVTTLRNSNPNIWQITKNPSKAQSDHGAWKKRKAEAKKKIVELVKTGCFNNYVLQGVALAIIDVNADKLTGEQLPTGILPLQPSSANVPPAVSSKRPALEDLDSQERSKKAKPSTNSGGETMTTRRGPIEIIDLT
ncbi:hypothetical protein PV04_04573 [Phialophora macrospora]|uniref:Fe2OG dioxygenase domain-containing protein n=1 Tax=Phialophora macrospora TaxID=1851006 RepID=A0A0D2G9M6_9EURO|nr:hypothetical protein PV04_04573 [Phialophora macrospora]